MQTTSTLLARRVVEIRRDLFGDHGALALAERLGLPAGTWMNYESGSPFRRRWSSTSSRSPAPSRMGSSPARARRTESNP
jgi:hypothetical protein